MGELSFVASWDDDWVVVHLTGALVGATVPLFTRRLHELASRRVRIDLAGVTELDAAGVDALDAARTTFERNGRAFEVVHAPDGSQDGPA